MRRNWIFLITTIVLVVGTFLGALALDKTPVLGLDLQGGVSVVLSPQGKYNQDSLDVAIDVIRNRADSFGTLEPEISRSGSDVVIDLPGVKDRAKAVRLVGQTAQLRFRPVLAQLGPEGTTASTTTTTGAPGASTTAPTTTTTLPKSEQDAAAAAAIAPCDTTKIGQLTTIPTTSRADDVANKCIVAKDRSSDNRFLLGPTAMTGKGVSSAKSEFSAGNGWVVLMNLNDRGSKQFNVGRQVLRADAAHRSGRHRARRRRAVEPGVPGRFLQRAGADLRREQRLLAE